MTDIEVLEHEEAQARIAEEAMRADGVPTEDRRQQSYFGFAERHKCFFPDGVSYIEHATLNEGARKEYQNAINREVVIKRQTQDAAMKMAAGDERHQLLRAAIVGWNLIDSDGTPLPFDKGQQSNGRVTRKGTLDRFLEEADPKLIDMIHMDIQKKNPWLLGEMTVEDIDKQIRELQEMRDVKVAEDEGKDS